MLAGNQYRYFMVFQSKAPDYPGAYSYDRFMEILKGLQRHNIKEAMTICEEKF